MMKILKGALLGGAMAAASITSVAFANDEKPKYGGGIEIGRAVDLALFGEDDEELPELVDAHQLVRDEGRGEARLVGEGRAEQGRPDGAVEIADLGFEIRFHHAADGVHRIGRRVVDDLAGRRLHQVAVGLVSERQGHEVPPVLAFWLTSAHWARLHPVEYRRLPGINFECLRCGCAGETTRFA